MPHYDGKKARGTHTTCSDLTAKVAGIAARLQEVTGISPGILQNGKGVTGGTQKVKFGEMDSGFLILTIRQSRSVQQLRIFGSDLPAARLALARALRDEDIPIAFQH